MFNILLRLINDSPKEIIQKIKGVYAFLIIFNILAWVLALISFHQYPKLLAVSLVSFGFGLRHAVDADHIAIIDNVTRKLMQDGKRPVTVGLFFSFGHSVIVLIMSAAIVLTSATIKNYFPQLEEIGGIVGTLISAFSLFVIAAINFIVLLDIYKIFQRVKKGGSYSEESLDETLNQRGLIGRFFCPLIKIVNHSWYMFPIGILLGLGFDTATEVGLLGIAATSATQGMPAVSIMIFPILFTAGMSLIDTTDGILMLGAYGWAFLKPIRKIYYNLSITSISIMVAVFVGSIETLGLFQNKLNLKGAFWDSISYVNDDNNLGIIGFSIIGIFIVAWIGSTILYKLKKYDRL